MKFGKLACEIWKNFPKEAVVRGGGGDHDDDHDDDKDDNRDDDVLWAELGQLVILSPENGMR